MLLKYALSLPQIYMFLPFSLLSGTADCGFALFLCILALPNKCRGKEVLSGIDDLPQEESTNCSSESWKTLSPTVESSNVSTENNASRKQHSPAPSMSGDQILASEYTYSHSKQVRQLSTSPTMSKEKRRLVALSSCRSSHLKGFWMSACTK